MTIRFTKEVLQSYGNFQNFLEDRKAIEEILKEKDTPLPLDPQSGQIETRLGILGVARLRLTRPLYKIYATFVDSLGTLIGLTGARETPWQLYKHAHFYRTLPGREINANTVQKWTGKNYLVRCLNQPASKHSDIYSHPSIRRDAIKDEKILDCVSPDNEYLNFHSLGGICYGINEWFTHLYLQTEGAFADKERHLIILANLFKEGAPRQSLVLQPLQISHSWNLENHKKSLLPLDKVDVGVIRNEKTNDPATLIKKIDDLFNSLSPGIYHVIPSRHTMSFIKTSQKSYLVDPNLGLIAFPSSKAANAFMVTILRVYEKSDSDIFVRVQKVTQKYFTHQAA